jgi:hypothetical protein
MSPNQRHQLHPEYSGDGQTHVEILDEKDLSDLVEQEPSNKDEEISPPQVMDVQRVSGGDISQLRPPSPEPGVAPYRVHAWFGPRISGYLDKPGGFRGTT